MEIRKPKSTDLFIVGKIIGKIGLKNIIACINSKELMELRAKMIKDNEVTDKKGKVTQKDFTDSQLNLYGIEVVANIGDLILNNLENVKDDVNRYISNLTELSIKEIEDLSIVPYAEILMTIIKEPDFVDFIKVVLKSFN